MLHINKYILILYRVLTFDFSVIRKCGMKYNFDSIKNVILACDVVSWHSNFRYILLYFWNLKDNHFKMINISIYYYISNQLNKSEVSFLEINIINLLFSLEPASYNYGIFGDYYFDFSLGSPIRYAKSMQDPSVREIGILSTRSLWAYHVSTSKAYTADTLFPDR